MGITALTTPHSELSSEETILARTHLSILICACFELNRRVHYVFALTNIYIDFKVPETDTQQIQIWPKNASKHLKHPILIYFSWNIRSWSQSWIQTSSVLVADSLFQDLTQLCTMKKTLVHTLALSLNRTETVHTLSRYKINLFQVLTELLAWQSFSTILFQYRF